MTGCCVERTDDQLGADDELDAKKNLEEAEKGLRICSKMADKEELFFFWPILIFLLNLTVFVL